MTESTANLPEYISREDAAGYLGVSRQTVSNYIKSGFIPSVCPSGRHGTVFIPKSFFMEICPSLIDMKTSEEKIMREKKRLSMESEKLAQLTREIEEKKQRAIKSVSMCNFYKRSGVIQKAVSSLCRVIGDEGNVQRKNAAAILQDFSTGMPVSEISVKYGITTAAVNMSIDKTLRQIAYLQNYRDVVERMRASEKECDELRRQTEQMRSQMEKLKEVEQKREERRWNPLMAKTLSDMDLSNRSLSALKKSNIMTVGDVMGYQPEQIMNMPGVGRKTTVELEDAFRKLGLKIEFRGYSNGN